MPTVELLMPKLGESIIEATILTWNKQVGDSVDIDESVLEIATDKVDSEVPSEVAGTITKLLFKEGDVVPVGEAVALIETEGGASNTSTPAESQESPAAVKEIENTIQQAVETVQNEPVLNSEGARFYSPLVLNIAKEENISMSELETVPGTGKDGRVTKDDLKIYLKGNPTKVHRIKGQILQKPTSGDPVQSHTTSARTESVPVVSSSISGNVEIIEMDRVRKMISKHMVQSVQTSPHVTTFVEADVTNLVNWRNRVKDGFQKREGQKITFTPIFMEIVSKVLKEFPYVNCSLEGDNIILKKDINIGMATALPNGNLIVPVIKNIDQLNLMGITKKVNDLANRARGGKLKPDETAGGTYTLTNVGSFGNLMGTPIINQPQVGILAVGSIIKKPVVLETPEGDVIAIRHMMFLSHSYDHRIVDGAMGGKFVRRVADLLEQFDITREI